MAEQMQGALLIADITGFTALSERLADRDKKGAEELTFFLNEYFEIMVDIVTELGGDILQFGGDSLLAAFGAARVAATSGDGNSVDQRPVETHFAAASNVLNAVRWAAYAERNETL